MRKPVALIMAWVSITLVIGGATFARAAGSGPLWVAGVLVFACGLVGIGAFVVVRRKGWLERQSNEEEG
jgi:hypothetical protein